MLIMVLVAVNKPSENQKLIIEKTLLFKTNNPYFK